MWTLVRERVLELAPLALMGVAATFGAWLLVGSSGGALAFYAATPFFVCGVSLLFATLVPPVRRMLLFGATVGTPFAGACVPAAVCAVSVADPTLASERGALTSMLVVCALLPPWIAGQRSERAAADAPTRHLAVHRRWCVAAAILACGIALLWVPPSAEPWTAPRFDSVFWNPPTATWLEGLRRTANAARITLAGCSVLCVVILARDMALLRAFVRAAERRGSDERRIGPYRQSKRERSGPEPLGMLRAATRLDATCLLLSLCAGVYFAARLSVVESRTEIVGETQSPPGQLVVPSLQHQCSQIDVRDDWHDVQAHLTGREIVYDRLGPGRYRWYRRHASTAAPRGSCFVTFEERDKYWLSVTSVEYRVESGAGPASS